MASTSLCRPSPSQVCSGMSVRLLVEGPEAEGVAGLHPPAQSSAHHFADGVPHGRVDARHGKRGVDEEEIAAGNRGRGPTGAGQEQRHQRRRRFPVPEFLASFHVQRARLNLARSRRLCSFKSFSRSSRADSMARIKFRQLCAMPPMPMTMSRSAWSSVTTSTSP